MPSYNVVGQRLPRIDAVEKATGQVTYGVDVRTSGMLYGKVLRSPRAHARIRRIDTSRAEAIPGVKAVITGKDVPDKRVGLALKDEHILAKDKVRFIGDPVAAVAAVDEDTAERALDAIEVEYEDLPAVFDAEEARRPGAPIIHEDLDKYEKSAYLARFFRPLKGTNVCNHFKLRKGDAEKGFRAADVVFEDVFRAQMVSHAYIEPHAVLASVGPSGKVTVWTNAQRPFDVRNYLADLFDWPRSRVRVIATKVGGGFGGKIAPKLQPIAVALALKARRPVKMVLTRTEELSCVGGRHGCRVQVKTGVKKDGTILAQELELLWDTGAYTELGVSVATACGFAGAGPYEVPNVKIDSYLVYTNKLSATSLRGMGMPQVTWAVESQLDIIAEKLGIDPVDLRLKNIFHEGSISATGEVIHSVGLERCLRQAAQAIGWGQPESGPHRGRGIAIMHKFSAPGSMSAAVVMVNEDGTVTLLTGASDIGQGSDTVLAQIAAEELGVSLEDINVVSADTGTTPWDHGAFSSRITFNAGRAVQKAAADARAQLLAVAAQMMEADPGQLEVWQGQVRLKGASNSGLPLAQVARYSFAGNGVAIVGKGMHRGAGSMATLDPETGQGPRPSSHWEYGAEAVEVEVDPETGQVKVLQIASAHDVGLAINPLSVEGQMEGSLVQGLGFTFLEETILDQGQVTNPTFMDYRLLTVAEVPPIRTVEVETPHREGPFGAKGIGEAGVIALSPAIANAVAKATGVRIKELPITPEKVLDALDRAKDRD